METDRTERSRAADPKSPITYSLMMVALAMGGIAPASPAFAQTITSQQQSFDIPAQSLSRALMQFSEATGTQLFFDADIVRGKSSPGVRGTLNRTDALSRLLAGSGLTYRASGNTVTIARGGITSQGAEIGPDGPLVLDPITITANSESGFRSYDASSATNVPAPLIETPATVNVMSADTLERINPSKLDDILQYIPGAAPGATGSSMTNTFTIRGFESSTARGGSLGTRANSVYIDGHRPASRHYHYDRSLYDRVEVLKGTSSLLYGTASPGGIVSYRSKKPDFEAQNQLSATLGGFDMRRISIDSTGPIKGFDGFTYRLIGTVQKAHQTSTGENHPNSYDNRYILKPQLAWESDSGTRVDLAYEYSRQENVADPGILRFSDGSFGFHGPSLVSDESFMKHTNRIATARVETPVNDQWSVWLDGSYGKNDIDALWDSVNTRTAPSRTSLIDRDIIRFETDFEHKEATAGLKGNYQLGSIGTVTTTIGASLRRESYNSKRLQQSIRGVIDPLNPVFTPIGDLGPYTGTVDWTIEEKAIYIQNYAELGENLKLFGGLRYTDVETLFNDNGGRDKSLDYSLGAIYNQNSWLNPFISYSTSLTPQVGTLDTGAPVPFSEGKQFEIGIKSQWLGDRLASTVSAFQIKQTNRVETDPSDRTLSVIAGDQQVKGLEVEVVGDITRNLSVSGGYSYLDAEYTSSVSYEGNTPANVPRHKATVMLNYAFENDLGLWDAGLGYIYVRNRQGDNDNSFTLPDYSRVDLNLGWQRDGIELRLRVENLFDKDYVSGSSGVFLDQGRPRTVSLNLQRTF